MRVDNTNFEAKNSSLSKEPRYTIEVSFDDANTDLYYFTSHSDSATPPAATVISSIIEGLSVTSQSIKPEKALASIGSISFDVVDKDNAVRAAQASELAFGNSLKYKRVVVYMGYEGLAWADYITVQTQIIDSVTYKDGTYSFKCSDVQRLERKDIFDLARTTLASSITASQDTITVYDTSEFEAVKHSSSWSDAPSQTVYYVKIEDEVIRATGKTATTFTGCTRGALNTKASAHTINTSDSADRRTEVSEYVYLEMPAPKLIYAIMTGILHGDSANLPTSWHLGIDTDYVKLSDFTGAGDDVWNLSDESIGAVLRFEGEQKQDGKKFIETQINLAIASFNPVYSTGELGLKRMANVISNAAPVMELNEDNIVSYGSLKHDMGAVRNHLRFLWNWEPTKEKFTRSNILFDTDSITLNGLSVPEVVKLRGINGNHHTTKTIEQIFDKLRDRYSEPPIKINIVTQFINNTIEVGDVIQLNVSQIMDYNTDAEINRAFEVQRVSIDWIKGTVNLSLFGSAVKAGTIVRSATNTVLSDAYYTNEGNNLKTYVGGGYDAGTDYSADHIVANCQLTGGSDLTNASYIFYHDGDLTIDTGVTVTITENMQLRVKGFLTVNGTINGKGQANVSSGYQGYVGNARAGGGMYVSDPLGNVTFVFSLVASSFRSNTVAGLNAAAPELSLDYDSTTETINGLPTSLRGSKSGSGSNIIDSNTGAIEATGGAAGEAGAGLFYTGRGIGFGASGKIDLSGTDGVLGGETNRTISNKIEAGGGSGGGSGAFYSLLDGSSATAVYDDTNLVLCQGDAPQRYPPYNPAVGGSGSSQYQGIRTYCGFEANQRVQYVPSPVSIEPDIPATLLTPPTTLTASSGVTHYLLQLDGTIIPRVLLEWVAAIDANVVGYEVQYKLNTGSLWTSGTNVLGAESTQTYVTGVTDGEVYDFRVRSAAGDGTSSEWLTLSSHIVLGKDEPPSDVPSFESYQNGVSMVLKWTPVTDADLSGYEIRYLESSGSGQWLDASILTQTTKGTNITTVDIPDGTWELMIKAVDTSGNYSTNHTSKEVVFSSNFDVIDSESFAPALLGTLTNLVRHHTGKLVPDSQNLASADDWDTFDISVPNPFQDCYYEVAEYDNSFDDTSRISATINSYLAPTEVIGAANPTLEIDYRVDAGSYNGFEAWSIGSVLFRYLKARAHIDTSVGVAILTDFTRIVDAIEYTQKAENVAILAVGTTITLPQPFHTVPYVDILVLSAVAVIATVTGKTSTQFTVNLFDTTGAAVAGSVDWKAIGV